ncbi:MAG: antitoxin VbhA family protein [Pseudobutyrivibrio sp.]|nr:antitoxin VbhA family protein [Pseudobutyrivibrio sp.]
MSTDEKIASVRASFAMEDMILTPQEIERGRMIIEKEVDVEDVVAEITSKYVSVG